jgi:hypothetical protein
MMAEKSLTLILLGADRKLWNGERARIQVTDLNHKSLKVLKDHRLDEGSSTVLLNLDLHFDAGQIYGLSVDVKKHRSSWQLLHRRSFLRQQGGTEVEVKDIIWRLMLVPRKTASSDVVNGHALMRENGSRMVVEGNGIKEDDYRELNLAEKMALLNIEAKLRETRINGSPLLSYVEGVRYVAVDRLFLFVKPELKQIIEDSAEFASAPGHGVPDGAADNLPAHPDSWKHRTFGAGNLQLSFSALTDALPGSPDRRVYSVDADIDLSKGIGHVFEFLDNHLLHPGKKTDQAQVYSLLFTQNIIPYYSLDPLAESDDED